MSTQTTLNPHFQVSVQVSYNEKESHPDRPFYLFHYQVRIENKGAQAAQLISRHWIISDDQGPIEEVQGPGVVGLQPKIIPGQIFEYESACPLRTSTGSMKGFYQMLGENGDRFDIEIPEFYLVAPMALH